MTVYQRVASAEKDMIVTEDRCDEIRKGRWLSLSCLFDRFNERSS
jgi:hypothetical protein